MYISTWVLIAVVIAVFYILERRFKRIESYINIPKGSSNNTNDLKPISYQAGISVDLEWIKVIRWCFPELKTDEEAWKFVEGLQKDSELKLDQEAGLFQKNFGFVEFYDGVSGLNPVWSNHYQGFTDELEVKGWVFGGWEGFGKLRDKFSDNRIGRVMLISPSFIGFRSDLPDGSMGDEDKISQFPYHSVISFFADIQKNQDKISSSWPGELMVKKFPEKIQQIFNKYQIKYDPSNYEDYGCGIKPKNELVKSKWLEEKGIELYDQKMRSHTFKTPYYTVTIRLKFFSPDDR
jgi:hypothetical protein